MCSTAAPFPKHDIRHRVVKSGKDWEGETCWGGEELSSRGVATKRRFVPNSTGLVFKADQWPFYFNRTFTNCEVAAKKVSSKKHLYSGSAEVAAPKSSPLNISRLGNKSNSGGVSSGAVLKLKSAQSKFKTTFIICKNSLSTVLDGHWRFYRFCTFHILLWWAVLFRGL